MQVSLCQSSSRSANWCDQGPISQTEISQTVAKIKASTNKQVQIKLLNIITYSYTKFNGDLGKPPLKWGHNGPLTRYENCVLRMRRECRERFPRHRLERKPLFSDPDMHHGTCVPHVPWCMSGSLTRGGGEYVPCIPGLIPWPQLTPNGKRVPISSWHFL